MKHSRNLSIFALLLICSALTLRVEHRIRKRFRTTLDLKFNKDAAKAFAQGAVSEFIGIDAECLGGKLVDNSIKLPDKVSPDLLGIVEGLMVVRFQIYSFFEKKFDEWSESKRGAACKIYQKTLGKLVPSEFVDSKFAKYQDKITYYKGLRDASVQAYERLVPLYTKCTTDIADGEMESVLKTIQNETDKLMTDLKEFIAAFRKKGFTDVVEVTKINDLTAPFADPNDLGELQTMCQISPPSAWESTKKMFDNLKKYYDSASKSTLVCILKASLGVKSLIEAALNNAFLFAPGLQVVAIIWRATKLAIYLGKAIYYIYQGHKKLADNDKYLLYGRGLGSFLRGIVYLAIGGRKKRRVKNKI